MPAVRVEQGTLEAFKKAVVGKHGKLRGVMQTEVNRALRNHAQFLQSEQGAEA